VEDAVRGANLIALVSGATEPILRSDWVEDGAHVCAVGACRPTHREMDGALVARARLIVDSRAGALAEADDVILAMQENRFGPDHIAAEIGEIVAGRASGRTASDEVTVFKSLGMAIEDVAAASGMPAGVRRGLGGASRCRSTSCSGSGAPRQRFFIASGSLRASADRGRRLRRVGMPAAAAGAWPGAPRILAACAVGGPAAPRVWAISIRPGGQAISVDRSATCRRELIVGKFRARRSRAQQTIIAVGGSASFTPPCSPASCLARAVAAAVLAAGRRAAAIGERFRSPTIDYRRPSICSSSPCRRPMTPRCSAARRRELGPSCFSAARDVEHFGGIVARADREAGARTGPAVSRAVGARPPGRDADRRPRPNAHYDLGSAVGLRTLYIATVEAARYPRFAPRGSFDEHERVLGWIRRKDAGLTVDVSVR
jgi:hypothetical protein